MNTSKFSIHKGRPRPEYKARQIKCGNCGAALAVKDERAMLMICEYCGSRLDISSAEQKVLGKQTAGKPKFTFEIGDSYRFKGARFEIIGRMAFIEDGDLSEKTIEYLLYHPCMGSMWLGEYKEEFTISKSSHVMPRKMPASTNRGENMTTWDGMEWVLEDSGTYRLIYVDGALPWKAKAGDGVSYLEFAACDSSGKIYEIQQIKNEIEYSTGKRLKIETVRRATDRPDLFRKKGIEKLKSSLQDPTDAAVTRKNYLQTIAITAICTLVNFLLCAYCFMAGDTVLSQHISANDLTQGVYTKPFQLSGRNNTIRITIAAMLNNAWMSLDTMLVKEGDLMVHEYEPGIEYYSGVDGGESWSEGDRENSFMLIVPESGTYRLFIQGVSANGNAIDAKRAIHDIHVTVVDRAQPWGALLVAAIFCFLILTIVVIKYQAWKENR